IPAADQRNPHGAEIITAGSMDVGLDYSLTRLWDIALDPDGRPGEIAAQRQLRYGSDGLNAGQPSNAILELSVEIASRGGLGVPGSGEAQTERQDIPGGESGTDRLQPDEAANQEPRAGEEDQRESDFRYDESAAGSGMAGAARVATAFFQHFIDIDPR